jgi:hypothetical protein
MNIFYISRNLRAVLRRGKSIWSKKRCSQGESLERFEKKIEK